MLSCEADLFEVLFDPDCPMDAEICLLYKATKECITLPNNSINYLITTRIQTVLLKRNNNGESFSRNFEKLSPLLLRKRYTSCGLVDRSWFCRCNQLSW